MTTEDYNRFYVGYNPTKIRWDDGGDYWDLDTSFDSSVTLGYLHGSNIVKDVPLYLEWGANAQYTFGSSVDSDIYMLSVNAPVNLAFRFSFNNNDISVTPYLGVNFRVNILGEKDYDGEWSCNIFDDSDEEAAEYAAKRFQAGVNFGVGFSYKVLYLGVGYTADFTKFVNYKEDNFVGKLGVTTLTVGFNF